MASVKDVKRTKSGRITYRGESFPGFNKQVRTTGGNKKFKVLAKKGDLLEKQLKMLLYGRKIKLALESLMELELP